MSMYRSKPVVIEAHPFNGQFSFDEMLDDWGEEFDKAAIYHNEMNDLKIVTLEGTMQANLGDWIIKGLRGEFYPCKPDVFAAKYEPV